MPAPHIDKASGHSSSVDTYSGEYMYSHVDMALYVGGNVVSFTRSYSSSAAEVGALGLGWTHNFQMRLMHVPGTQNDVELWRADGRHNVFNWSPDNRSYTSRPGFGATLVDSLTEYDATVEDQHLTLNEGGLLTRLQSGSQPPLTVVQGPDGPTQVTDENGTVLLEFAYRRDGDVGARLASVTELPHSQQPDAPPRTIGFTYDTFGRLASVTDPGGANNHL